MKITKAVSPAFEDFVFDWDYETYLLVGGYGSGKSYHIAFKIILKLLEEKRKCLVVREVFDTIYESCYSLFTEILQDMGLFTDDTWEFKKSRNKNKVLCSKSPLSVRFPNGSRIIFKGMDNPQKVKSINGVSIVWMEEASEVKFAGYEELQGRIRTPDSSMHFILSTNPVGRENWIYRYFFASVDEEGNDVVKVDEREFYDKGVLVHDGVYYHHSIPTDNPWLPPRYIARLDKIKEYDYPLYVVARWGEFGAAGIKVLPQLSVAPRRKDFLRKVRELGPENQYFGFDFGFESSFNAVVSMSVDIRSGTLYIWDEIYMNHITDPDFARLPEMQKLKERLDEYAENGINKMIVADSEDPKAIAYYRQCGFRIRGARNKFAGSRLSNTRKIKRFHSIVVSPKCKNVIRELKDLTYKQDRQGNFIYDEFSCDPHTFSAIWYALDTLTLADVKDRRYFSKKGY